MTQWHADSDGGLSGSARRDGRMYVYSAVGYVTLALLWLEGKIGSVPVT